MYKGRFLFKSPSCKTICKCLWIFEEYLALKILFDCYLNMGDDANKVENKLRSSKHCLMQEKITMEPVNHLQCRLSFMCAFTLAAKFVTLQCQYWWKLYCQYEHGKKIQTILKSPKTCFIWNDVWNGYYNGLIQGFSFNCSRRSDISLHFVAWPILMNLFQRFEKLPINYKILLLSSYSIDYKSIEQKSKRFSTS